VSLADRASDLIQSEHVLWGVGAVSFLESILIPVPLEAVLIPAMQINRERLWKLAGAALGGCMLGALVGYGVGFFLFEAFGRQLVEMLSSAQEFELIRERMDRQGFWFVLSIGVTPVPFQIAMLAAGATAFSLPLFIAATGIARAVRYFGLALIVWKFGERAERIVRRHRVVAGLVVSLMILLVWWLAGGWAGG